MFPTAFKISHHSLIEVCIKYCLETNISNNNNRNPLLNNFSYLNFFGDSINWTEIKHEFSSVNWELQIQNLSTTEMFNKRITACEEITRKHIPMKRNTSNNKNHIPKIRRKHGYFFSPHSKINIHIQIHIQTIAFLP